ncbi:hypothetical protein ACFU93_44225 [Streptomyces sp. NPDC057611]|uniref:hypothetical protein n=1 Tax=Streptomyces sp. NPDC057611 TaxID=3346182 RepID=UPI0036BC058D
MTEPLTAPPPGGVRLQVDVQELGGVDAAVSLVVDEVVLEGDADAAASDEA